MVTLLQRGSGGNRATAALPSGLHGSDSKSNLTVSTSGSNSPAESIEGMDDSELRSRSIDDSPRLSPPPASSSGAIQQDVGDRERKRGLDYREKEHPIATATTSAGRGRLPKGQAANTIPGEGGEVSKIPVPQQHQPQQSEAGNIYSGAGPPVDSVSIEAPVKSGSTATGPRDDGAASITSNLVERSGGREHNRAPVTPSGDSCSAQAYAGSPLFELQKTQPDKLRRMLATSSSIPQILSAMDSPGEKKLPNTPPVVLGYACSQISATHPQSIKRELSNLNVPVFRADSSMSMTSSLKGEAITKSDAKFLQGGVQRDDSAEAMAQIVGETGRQEIRHVDSAEGKLRFAAGGVEASVDGVPGDGQPSRVLSPLHQVHLQQPLYPRFDTTPKMVVANTISQPPGEVATSSRTNAVGTTSPVYAGVGEAMNLSFQHHSTSSQHFQTAEDIATASQSSSCAASYSTASSCHGSSMHNTPPLHLLSSAGNASGGRCIPPQRQVKPILYSAIGSLEQYNANNMGSFNNRIIMANQGGPHTKQGAQGSMGPVTTFTGPNAPRIVSNSSGMKHVATASQQDQTERLVPEAGPPSKVRRAPTHSNQKEHTLQKGSLSAQGTQPSSQPKTQQKLNRESQQKIVGEKKKKVSIDKKDKVNKAPTSKQTQVQRNRVGLRSEGVLKPSALRRGSDLQKGDKQRGSNQKRVKIITTAVQPAQPVEMFRPSCDAYTPRMERKKIAYKPAELRTPVQKMSTTMGTISRPNFRDALRRVAMIIQQHVVKIERRFEGSVSEADGTGLFKTSMKEAFHEDNFATPRYKCTMVRVPMARPGTVYSMRKIRVIHTTPTADEIYDFGHQLFKSVQLSSECSIVCLIYVERLMEVAKVPLVASTWRPIFMCGLLLASKVWQDLSSWNIEFATVYPQFSLDAINRLELQFLRMVKWDLYISSSLYAKYYFALRSLLEKKDFRNRYNRMVGGVGGVSASEALKVQKRSEAVKEEALLQLSRSM